MSKFISSNELWDNVCKNIGYPNNPRGKVNICIEQDYGRMNINHYNTGFGIRYTSIAGFFKDDTIVENTNSFDINFLCFNSGNNIYMEDTLKHKRVKWDSDICMNGELFIGHKCNSIYPKNQQIQLHHISFDKKLFHEVIQNNDNFKNTKQIYKGDYIDVNFNNHINLNQKILLNDLAQTSNLNSGKLQELYLESKLLDLVYTSLNSIETKDHNDTFILSQKDIECLYKAKNLLLENIQNPPSLKELAYKSAINEFKLKKGFKQVFGMTVYGMLHEYRLDYAKNLLVKNDISIQEAAGIVGYNSMGHFSKIFKEKYGILPIEFKKDKNIYII
ncbi:MAG: AraC family transcriptional regulator [Arcobacteraceae bacterium]|nr:AraC family transcriptional regulator [Arcobacteraceae bacterium]